MTVPLETETQRFPLEEFEHPFRKLIVTPPGSVVPVMLKTAVNNRPVAPCGVRNPKGPIIANSTVEGLSVG
jgi:hypothetical protein